MRKNHVSKNRVTTIALALSLQLVVPGALSRAAAQTEKPAYAAMAPLDQYLIPDEKSEIALARSAAPASISDAAEVMVLGREGYKTAVKGTNGFLCIVERSWGQGTDQGGWPRSLGHLVPNREPPASRFAHIFALEAHNENAGRVFAGDWERIREKRSSRGAAKPRKKTHLSAQKCVKTALKSSVSV